MTTAAPARHLPVEEARERMLQGVEPLPAESVPLDAALGRVLAESIGSRTTLPPWDNSAMDGFAVRSADVASASFDMPTTLPVVGEAAAGHQPTAAVGPGTAVRILTGAPLPEGADAVVPLEMTDAPLGAAALPERVMITRSVERGEHVRPAGSDLVAGQPLLGSGVELSAVMLGLAAAGGHAALAVHRRPRLAVLSTGDELVAVGQPLGPAQIPDSNAVGLGALARQNGADVRRLGIARDSLDEVLDRLRAGVAWADVVVASGGVSVGAHDVVKDAFARVGQVDLWRVAVQPGKPVAFGRAPRSDGARDVLLFGLPGNPVSSLVTFELFVRPVVRRLGGHADPVGRATVSARLVSPVTKAAGRRAFLRVRLERDGTGWRAQLAGGQGSHVLSALAVADGLAIVPEDVDGLPAGAEVEVIDLR